MRREQFNLDLSCWCWAGWSIQLRQVLLDDMATMVRGSIPAQEQPSALVDVPEIGEKPHRILHIAFRRFPNHGLARQQIQGPVIRLALTNIVDRDEDSLSSRPPDIAARISPEQMTFIDHQHHAAFVDEGWRFHVRFFLIRFRASDTFLGSAFGWASWDFFQDIWA